MTKLRGLYGTGVVLLCLGISGCGSDKIVNPPDFNAPPPEVVLDATFPMDVNVGAGGLFDISSTGTIDATVDYTFADNMLVLYIASGECTGDMWAADQCEYVAASFDGPKPRTLSATNQPAGAYTLVILNRGPQAESFAVQVVFTAQPGAASRTGGSNLSSSRRWPAPVQKF